MRLGVVSDTHMMKKNMDKIIPYLKECDLIVHAGDNFRDSKYLHEMTNTDVIAVKGNCDFENVEEEIVFGIEERTIFLCHGDRYGVKYGIEDLKCRAKEMGADIAIFGHSHTPFCMEDENILYLNPGSTSLPRGVMYKSFVILNINGSKVEVEEVKI